MSSRTEYLEILRRMRIGLNLPKERYITVHYTATSLVTLIRFEDGKLYRVEIEEVQSEVVGPTVDSNNNNDPS